jgi:hypothetical protein
VLKFGAKHLRRKSWFSGRHQPGWFVLPSCGSIYCMLCKQLGLPMLHCMFDLLAPPSGPNGIQPLCSIGQYHCGHCTTLLIPSPSVFHCTKLEVPFLFFLKQNTDEACTRATLESFRNSKVNVNCKLWSSILLHLQAKKWQLLKSLSKCTISSK